MYCWYLISTEHSYITAQTVHMVSILLSIKLNEMAMFDFPINCTFCVININLLWFWFQSGFALGIILVLSMGGICLYTCYLVLKSTESVGKWCNFTTSSFIDSELWRVQKEIWCIAKHNALVIRFCVHISELLLKYRPIFMKDSV